VHLAHRLLLHLEQEDAKRFVICREPLTALVQLHGHGDDIGCKAGGRLPGRPVPLVLCDHG
jgi:hypothetical protein